MGLGALWGRALQVRERELWERSSSGARGSVGWGLCRGGEGLCWPSGRERASGLGLCGLGLCQGGGGGGLWGRGSGRAAGLSPGAQGPGGAGVWGLGRLSGPELASTFLVAVPRGSAVHPWCRQWAVSGAARGAWTPCDEPCRRSGRGRARGGTLRAG